MCTPTKPLFLGCYLFIILLCKAQLEPQKGQINLSSWYVKDETIDETITPQTMMMMTMMMHHRHESTELSTLIVSSLTRLQL